MRKTDYLVQLEDHQKKVNFITQTVKNNNFTDNTKKHVILVVEGINDNINHMKVETFKYFSFLEEEGKFIEPTYQDYDHEAFHNRNIPHPRVDDERIGSLQNEMANLIAGIQKSVDDMKITKVIDGPSEVLQKNQNFLTNETLLSKNLQRLKEMIIENDAIPTEAPASEEAPAGAPTVNGEEMLLKDPSITSQEEWTEKYHAGIDPALQSEKPEDVVVFGGPESHLNTGNPPSFDTEAPEQGDKGSD